MSRRFLYFPEGIESLRINSLYSPSPRPKGLGFLVEYLSPFRVLRLDCSSTYSVSFGYIASAFSLTAFLKLLTSIACVCNWSYVSLKSSNFGFVLAFVKAWGSNSGSQSMISSLSIDAKYSYDS